MNETILPVDIPEDAAPLSEASTITSASVYTGDLYALDGQNVHVTLINGDSLTGMILFDGKQFTVGPDDYKYRVSDVAHFREV